MARIRSVKPEFWEDEAIAILSRDARLLFIASWNFADDEGLLRWTPEYIKAQVFMYDDDLEAADAQRLMDELGEAGLVHAYKGGKLQQRLGWIVNFHKHQKPNRPQPGKLPPPSLQNREVVRAYAQRDGWCCHLCGEVIESDPTVIKDNARKVTLDHLKPRSKGGSDYPSNIRIAHSDCNSGKRDRFTGSFMADELMDSVNDAVNDSVNDASPEGRGEEGRGGVHTPSTDVDPVEDSFEQFWDIYPKRNGKKVGKANALIEWRKLTLDERRRAYIGARNLSASDTLPKDPERFLRRGKGGKGDYPFDDWQEASSQQGVKAPKQDPVAAEMGPGWR